MKISLKIIMASLIALGVHTGLEAASGKSGKTAAIQPAAPESPVQPALENNSQQLQFMSDPDVALAKAKQEYRPVFLLFSSPECQWCIKLKEEILRDPEIKKLLGKFILVDIDIRLDNTYQWNYMIQGVPSMIFLSSEGQPRARLDGFPDKNLLKKTLAECSGNQDLVVSDADFEKILKILRNEKVPDDKWPDIMLLLGKGMNERKELTGMIFKMKERPAPQLIKMLSDKRLAVRLGALELLEELAGDDFGFDPWTSPETPSPANAKAIEKLNEWAGQKTADKNKIFSALTEERCRTLLNEIIGQQSERSIRAARSIEAAGKSMVPVIRKFLDENKDMPEGSRKKILQVLYSIMLAERYGMEAPATAHKLLFGNIDTQLKTIRDISSLKSTALPILSDFLDASDPIVRETAADSIAETKLGLAAKILDKRLATEKDHEVRFSILKGLGKIHSNYSISVLLKTLEQTSDEDLVIAILSALGERKASGIDNQLAKCLKDERWRIRAAALECISKVKQTKLSPQVETMLDDKDEFVKNKAISVLAQISKSSGTAAEKLAALYLKDDNMKAPVLKALASMGISINKSFVDALDGKDQQTLMSLAAGLSGAGKSLAPIARKLATYDNPDISYPAIELIARRCMDNKVDVEMITAILENNDKNKIIAALSSLDIDDDNKFFSKYLFFKNKQRDSGLSILQDILIETQESSTESEKKQDSLNEVFDAFDEKKTDAPATAKKNKPSPDINEIFNAFDEPEKKKTAPQQKKQAVQPINTQQRFYQALKKLLKDSDNAEIKTLCAKQLLAAGDKNALEYLTKHFNEKSAEAKSEILSALEKIDSGKLDYIKILDLALSDSDQSTQESAIDCALDSRNTNYIQLIFSKLDEKGSDLNAYKLIKSNSSILSDMSDNGNLKNFSRKWALQTLSDDKASDNSRILALLLLSKCWQTQDTELVEKCIASTNTWVKRSALILLISKNERAFIKHIPAVLDDPSEYIRMTIPEAYQYKQGNSSRHMIYFDENSVTHYYDYDFNSQRYGTKPRLPKKVQAALEKLTADPVPRVRLEAFLALLRYTKPVNKEALLATLSIFPDQDAIAEKISEILQENYTSMSEEAAVLLPYLDKAERIKDKEMKKIYAFFRKNYDEENMGVENGTYLARSEGKTDETTAPDIQTGTTQTVSPAATDKLRLVYFYQKGCKDCAKVHRLLDNLKELFPEMEIEEHDIGMVKSMKLNEAYCERFEVPEKNRLVAPAIFGKGGYLVKGNIGFENLSKLMADSFRSEDQNWYIVMPDEMNSSEKRITARYEKISIAMIVSAGFLDGINPCAFATIIFFLSYLAVARRNPRELLFVGLSFIAGVFLAYLSLGFGFLEIIDRISVLKGIGKYFNYAVATMTLIIMLLSIYDGIMCLKGKMENMSLQLPEFLKQRIRTSIRVSMKMRHFVAAAFVTGVIVSFLELACTGQIYAPVLLFMLKSGADKTGAIEGLCLYNVAFILPLCIVFAFTYSGVRSEKFIGLMKKHTAWVKFATALLFLCLFILLLIL